jgi:hypothetical protein
MKVFILSFLLLSISASATDQFYGCGNSVVKSRHLKANKIINRVVKLIKNKDYSYHLEKGLKDYFDLSLTSAKDTNLILKVFETIKKVASKANTTKYRCQQESLGFWCMADVLAIVPPPKTKIYLCPGFFNRLSSSKQVGTIIHEWFHRWGGGKINYITENYCFESSGLDSEDLIKNADQYMLFIYSVGTDGGYLECF